MAINRTYESEATLFLRDLIKEEPHLTEERRKGRALWWEKSSDADEMRRQKESRVPQKPYVYQTEL